jgi:membrane associated rhomboid family serine protease/tetratricopeptide (TPR) repeat protein
MQDETSEERARAASSGMDDERTGAGATSSNAPHDRDDAAARRMVSGGGERTPAGLAARAAIPRRFTITNLLITANVAVFAAMVFSGVSLVQPTVANMIAWGANFGPLVADGQWWRLLTSAFLHVGILHLGMNMLALRALGVVERLFGTRGFLFIYFTSAIGASAASILWRPTNTSAGASGALFGLLGALLAFFVMHRRLMPSSVVRPMITNILVTIGINVAFGLSVSMVDNAAHLGGLATGFIAGLCLNRELERAAPGAPMMFVARPSRKPLFRSVALALLVLAAAALIPARIHGNPNIAAQVSLQQAREAFAHGAYDEAKKACDQAITVARDDAEAYALRGASRVYLGDHDGGARDLDRALELDDSLASAHAMRAQLRESQRNFDGALRDLDRLVALLPDDSDVHRERAEVLYAAGRWSDALSELETTASLHDHDAGDVQIDMWLARARLGRRDEATIELKRFLESFHAAQMDGVSRRIALVLVGEAALDTLLVLAENAEGAEDRGRALFVAASLRQLAGDKPKAAELFTQCVQLKGDPRERWRARAELERLAR